MTTANIGYKLLAFDLDGTLLDSGKGISERNRASLEAAAANGLIVVPATGRMYHGMPECVLALPFIRYIITVNGAAVIDAKETKTLYTAEIQAPDVKSFLTYARELPALWDCYKAGEAFMDGALYAKIDEYIKDRAVSTMVRSLRTPVHNLFDRLTSSGQPVQKLQLFFKDLSIRNAAMRDMTSRFPQLEFSSSYDFNIEINAKGADKGSALIFLCGHLGMETSRAVAFGDGDNDIAMLRAAGLGVAMSNGTHRAKIAADIITSSNDEDGLAQILESILLSM